MIPLLLKIVKTGIVSEPAPHAREEFRRSAPVIHGQILQKLGRALAIRVVDAGSCNGCELEIHALNNPYYTLEGIGIKFVASPRHADLLLVTGPVSVNMEEALRRTYDAIPNPKLVVAIGDCATCGGVSAHSEIIGTTYATRGPIANPKLVVAIGDCATCGGVFSPAHSYATCGRVASVIPVNHTIAGCPPNPTAIMAGILQAIAAPRTPSS